MISLFLGRKAHVCIQTLHDSVKNALKTEEELEVLSVININECEETNNLEYQKTDTENDYLKQWKWKINQARQLQIVPQFSENDEPNETFENQQILIFYNILYVTCLTQYV